MLTHTAYCSACDQDVQVVVTDAPVYSDQAPVDGPELVCLDFGTRCSGSLCPMFGLPRVLMGVRLARSGLRPDAFRTLTAPCQECGATVELQLLSDEYAHCPACGARNRLIKVSLGDDDFIALACAP